MDPNALRLFTTIRSILTILKEKEGVEHGIILVTVAVDKTHSTYRFQIEGWGDLLECVTNDSIIFKNDMVRTITTTVIQLAYRDDTGKTRAKLVKDFIKKYSKIIET